MYYNAINIGLNQNPRLTSYYTKGQIMRLGLKKYEVDYLCREGFLYTDLILLMCKFKDKYLFCDFVRKNLIKNCWW